MISRLLPLLLLGVCLPLLAEQRLPEDYWQDLLLETRDAGLERQLAEEARLQLRQEARDTQAQALSEARKTLADAEARREQLEAQQLQLEEELQEMQERLQRRSASLGEVFSVYEDEKSSLYGLLSDALITQQKPRLLEAFRPDQDQGVPSIQALEELWQGLQQTWLASAQVVRFPANWVDAEGRPQKGSVVRLGDIQLLNEQGLLRFESGQPAVLWSRQPREAQQQAEAFVSGNQDEVTLDPARGQTLRLYSHQPDLLERIQQGGYVGYLIIFLGGVGLLVALVQSLRLLAENQRVKRQLQQLDEPQASNSLGRVLAGLRRETVSASTHPEALEARMDELLLREAAGLERGLSWVKLLAAMAPLLGLLGTVTGMIATFQAITLFGTGDPAMMASGISQALMTTVLGLVTAVPLLLAHLLLQGRSRHLARTLEAETSAWLANRLGSQTLQRS
ncbi:MotA/TolQ/ExbB proton channel family protein [Marinospirillum sp.]|uniref:MotA/TolQ/ExbB proton channel family protein n=1 Tax=Marinospirillum sp. TaxID=2183934 RepID=UPI0028709495|nr:MotA/TolQ/ExbB proton channel family protein [Marinospirillum sp.]MDR9468786.1 MotA/TolQ/ExbB proton channel family protein [Marinospirillum sp.]